MEYVLVGIAVLFVCFVLWAIIKGNDFKSKEKEKKDTPPPPTNNNDEFIFVTQEKPKKVKIKKKEEKVDGDPVIVPVFAKQEQNSGEQQNNIIDEKEELYKQYIEKNGVDKKNEEIAPKNGATRLPVTDRDIEKRIEEIRRNNFEATSVPEPKAKVQETSYYGYGIGAGGHNHGSLRDPNFDPWPNENKANSNGKYSFDDDNSLFDDEDDDVIDMEAIDRIMSGSSFPKRTSKLGGGSVKQNLGNRKLSGGDMMIGQTIANRKGVINPFDDN